MVDRSVSLGFSPFSLQGDEVGNIRRGRVRISVWADGLNTSCDFVSQSWLHDRNRRSSRPLGRWRWMPMNASH